LVNWFAIHSAAPFGFFCQKDALDGRPVTAINGDDLLKPEYKGNGSLLDRLGAFVGLRWHCGID